MEQRRLRALYRQLRGLCERLVLEHRFVPRSHPWRNRLSCFAHLCHPQTQLENVADALEVDGERDSCAACTWDDDVSCFRVVKPSHTRRNSRVRAFAFGVLPLGANPNGRFQLG